jgi:hypothetical protein
MFLDIKRIYDGQEEA